MCGCHGYRKYLRKDDFDAEIFRDESLRSYFLLLS